MKKLAKLKYLPNNFEIVEAGDHVILFAKQGKSRQAENIISAK